MSFPTSVKIRHCSACGRDHNDLRVYDCKPVEFGKRDFFDHFVICPWFDRRVYVKQAIVNMVADVAKNLPRTTKPEPPDNCSMHDKFYSP